jgi:hypothetical protein
MRLTIICVLLILTCRVSAQDKTQQDSTSLQPLKKDLLLTAADLNSSRVVDLKEKFLGISNNTQQENTEAKNIKQGKPQAEGFKISSGVLYFAGAAVLAAVIYFLVPDNEPSGKPVSTFGIPVTPK